MPSYILICLNTWSLAVLFRKIMDYVEGRASLGKSRLPEMGLEAL